MQNKPLSAGAGRAEVEFPETIFPIEGFESLHDKHHVRILILEAGTKIAVVSIELTSIPAEVVADFKEIVSSVTGITTENILICATHTFSTPHFRPHHLCKSPEDLQQNRTLFEIYETAIKQAAISALAEMKTAIIGCELGECNINVNRDVLTDAGWWLGCNETGLSDKTVTVLRFDDLDGNPIALLFNFAVQASVLDASITSKGGRLLSTDLSGAASRFLEDQYEGKITAIFCIGAAADQAPALKSKFSYLGKEGQIKNEDLHEQGAILAESLGKRLGAEVLRVSKAMRCHQLQGPLNHEVLTLTCPGQIMPNDIQTIKPTKQYDFIADADREEPFEIITFGDVAMVCVRPELTCQTAFEIKQISPYPKTMILTMVNGGVKYMPDQEAYTRITYEAMNSPFGCGSAELLRDKVIQTLSR